MQYEYYMSNKSTSTCAYDLIHRVSILRWLFFIITQLIKYQGCFAITVRREQWDAGDSAKGSIAIVLSILETISPYHTLL
jgi:hypothetical protein